MKKVFISHSSKDRIYVGNLIRLLEGMEIPSANIFCSSFEGYGIPLGDYFLEVLKEELSEEVFVIFLLSGNFYGSPVCLCEMGAAWIKTSIHIPVLIPPFDYGDIKGVLSAVQGMIINDKSKLNSLYNQVRKFFNIIEFDINRWERRRDSFLIEVNKLISDNRHAFSMAPTGKDMELLNKYKAYYDLLSRCNVKEMTEPAKGIIEFGRTGEEAAGVSGILPEAVDQGSMEENSAMYESGEFGEIYLRELSAWGKCWNEFEKFQDIMGSVKVKLNSLPPIVRKVLYCYCSEKEFILNNSDEGKEFDVVLEAVEDDYLILEGRVVDINMKDPKIRKSADVLNNLKHFLDGTSAEFHSSFETVYEICAKIESRKFWNTMGMF